MNSKLKKYLGLSAILLCGAIIGIFVTLYWSFTTIDTQKKMGIYAALADSYEEADYLYRNARADIAIYKLKRTLELLELFEKSPYHGTESWSQLDKGQLYGRIGKLLKK